MKKLLLIFFALIIIAIIWYGESRKFFCLDNGKCVTVWKTFNNICYIIPGKYYGIMRPSTYSYIKTTNINNLDIIWKAHSDSIVVNSDDSVFIVNNFSKGVKINKYNLNEKYNDSLFTYFDGKYNRYRKGINYISIFIQENYATDKDGKKY